MIKKYKKKTIVITSILIVLPMIVGLILWNRLPDQIATHFSFDGTPDDWSPKAFCSFGMPLLLLIVHGFCIFVFPVIRNEEISAIRCSCLFCGSFRLFRWL